MRTIFLMLLMMPCTVLAEQQIGMASYYDSSNKTLLKSNNKSAYAAHKTLKLGTKVLVVALNTHKTIVVTIVDRGPFIKNRIIDVNMYAAKQLGMLKRGVTKVQLIPLT